MRGLLNELFGDVLTMGTFALAVLVISTSLIQGNKTHERVIAPQIAAAEAGR